MYTLKHMGAKSATIYAMGCGLIEVLASPIVEARPFENKEATMSLLHSLEYAFINLQESDHMAK